MWDTADVSTDNDASLRGRLHRGCVCFCMLHGGETWPVKIENELCVCVVVTCDCSCVVVTCDCSCVVVTCNCVCVCSCYLA